jgi:hypothetical protein
MRGLLASLLLGAWTATGAGADPAGASSTPVQLSWNDEMQVFGQATSVSGVRLCVFSSRNDDVTGLDFGGLASRTSGDQLGLQASVYSEVEGDLRGLQLGVLSANTDGQAMGVQWANLIARAGAIVGLQGSGLYSRALAVTGVQISLVNYADDLDGVQIGLLNIHRNGLVPVFPGLNIDF